MDSDIKVTFEEFTPDDSTKACLSVVADKLQFSAPSDAVLKIVLKKSAGNLLATCRIVSQAGIFVAEAIADQPIRAIGMVEEKIRKQLKNWKAHRFETSRLQAVGFEDAAV